VSDRHAQRCLSAALGRASRTAAAEERYARYVELRRSWTVRVAGWELGICERQAWRYEARRRAELELAYESAS
jgi:hypothetical protein